VDFFGTDALNGTKAPGEVPASRGDGQDFRENTLKGSKTAGGEQSSGRAERTGKREEDREVQLREDAKHKPGARNPTLSLLRLSTKTLKRHATP